MKRLLLYILIGIFFISFTSATVETLGIFEQDTCVDLKQAGVGLTSCNVTSIIYPNSTQALSEVVMSSINNIEFNYTYCNATALGQYIVTGFCTNTTEDIGWVYDFEVTPNGEETNLTKGILQLALFIVLLIFMIISTFGIFKLDHYIAKFTCYWVSHVLLIAVSFIAWNMGSNFLTGTPFITSMFKIIFYFVMISAFPMVLLSLAYIIYIHTVTDEIKYMMEKGWNEEEIERKMNKKKKGGSGLW